MNDSFTHDVVWWRAIPRWRWFLPTTWIVVLAVLLAHAAIRADRAMTASDNYQREQRRAR